MHANRFIYYFTAMLLCLASLVTKLSIVLLLNYTISAVDIVLCACMLIGAICAYDEVNKLIK